MPVDLIADIEAQLPTTGLHAITAQKLRTVLEDMVRAFGAKSLVADFGAVGDGSTDNSAAMNAFNTYAKAESTAGRGVVLNVPPGTYNFNMSSAYQCLLGIKKLHIIGYGAVFQNTYDPVASGSNFGAELPWPHASTPDLRVGYKINTTAVGTTTLTLKTLSDYSHIHVGSWIIVASLDIQSYGYPPNPDRFDFVKVTAVNSSTGVVTIDRPLVFEHRDDFPDLMTGQARIYVTDTDFNNLGAPNIFDVEHVYEGLEIRKPPNGTVPYIHMQGESIKLVNCTLPGISPSVCKRLWIEGGKITDESEPDKIVDSMLLDGVEITTSFGFQSSSVNKAVLTGCTIQGSFNHGTAKSVTVSGSRIGTVGEGGTYGMGRSAVYLNCEIHGTSFPFRTTDTSVNVDGTNFSYSNGTFKALKTFNDLPSCLAIPGGYVNLHTIYDDFSSVPGTGIVTKVYEDSTYAYFDTTLPYASIPSWSNGRVQISKLGRLSFIDCWGCDEVRRASEAYRKGRLPFEFYKLAWAGKCNGNGTFTNAFWGNLIRFRANVIQASTVSSARFTIGQNVSLPDLSNYQVLQFVIDLTVTGVREYTLTGMVGNTGADAPTLNGSAITVLPSNRFWQGGSVDWSFSYTPSDQDSTALPIVELELEFDCGNFRKTVPVQFDGLGHSLVGLTGLLP